MFHSYDLKAFGEAIRDIRKNSGYTQKNIREITGINTDTLRKIENGLVIPKYDTLEVLSIVYRYDLLRLLLHHRSESFIQNCSTQIDKIIISNSTEHLSTLVHDFKKYKTEHITDIEVIEHKHLQQFEIFIQGLKDYFSDKNPVLSSIRNNLVKALKVTVESFELYSADQFKYNFLEIRILLFIGIIMRKTNECTAAIKILRYCLEYLTINSVDEWNNIHLIIKTYFNLAYCYHFCDDHEMVIECTIEAIELARKHHSTYGLAHIYYRKGIAEHALGYPSAIESLTRSIQILEIEGEDSLAQKFKDVTFEIYGIQL